MSSTDHLEEYPAMQPADIARMVELAKNYALVILRKGPASRENEEKNERLQLAHLQHLAKLQLSGKLVLNGPILEEHDILGISIYTISVEEARKLAESDLKVQEGYLTVEVLPWMAVSSEEMIHTFKHLL
jgi:uncharacterized protein YciI